MYAFNGNTPNKTQQRRQVSQQDARQDRAHEQIILLNHEITVSMNTGVRLIEFDSRKHLSSRKLIFVPFPLHYVLI
jgi:hypothetical protein